MIFSKEIIKRFELKTSKNDSGCWLWTASRNKKNYGYFRVNQKTYLAHRISYSIYNSKINNGLFVLHKCDNPSCVNPDHLFLGTQLDNMKDMEFKKRRVTKAMIGMDHTLSRLTNNDVILIRNEYNIEKKNITSISNKYNVSRKLIYNIINRTAWKHIP